MAQVTHRPTGSRRTGSRLSIDHALVQIVRGLERHRDVIVGEPFDSRGPEDERARQVPCLSSSCLSMMTNWSPTLLGKGLRERRMRVRYLNARPRALTQRETGHGCLHCGGPEFCPVSKNLRLLGRSTITFRDDMGSVSSVETRLRGPDGRERWVRAADLRRSSSFNQ